MDLALLLRGDLDVYIARKNLACSADVSVLFNAWEHATGRTDSSYFSSCLAHDACFEDHDSFDVLRALQDGP
jgi:hypothetical protein